MPFLTSAELIDTLYNPGLFSIKMRRLAIVAAQVGKAGAIVLRTGEESREILSSEYEPQRDVPTIKLLRTLGALATNEEGKNRTHAGLLVSSRSKDLPVSDLLHPNQLRHYAEYAMDHRGTIGGSVSLTRQRQITLALFAGTNNFEPAPLLALDELATRAVTDDAIGNSGLLTVRVQFDSRSLRPYPAENPENLKKLFGPL